MVARALKWHYKNNTIRQILEFSYEDRELLKRDFYE